MLRFARVGGIATLLALVLAAQVVIPAAAAGPGSGRPDAAIRFTAYRSPFGHYPHGSRWLGHDIYNTTARGQTKRMTAMGVYERGTRMVFSVAIANNGGTDRFHVKASGSGSWQVRFYAGGRDITTAVVEGTYRTPVVAPGETFKIRAKVRLGGFGTSVMRHVLVSSVSAPQRQDAVRLRVRYSTCGC
jgi:hypothetical protein